jgi:hypothetical protein
VKKTIRHIYPSATIFFVPAFGNEVIAEDVILASNTSASNLREEEDISSIQIMRTVRNQPGTFNITLMDNGNKFILQDTPLQDIPKLYAFSQRKIQEQVFTRGNSKTISTKDPNKIFTQPPVGSLARLRQELKFKISEIQSVVTYTPSLSSLEVYSSVINETSGVNRLKEEAIEFKAQNPSDTSIDFLLKLISDYERIENKIKPQKEKLEKIITSSGQNPEIFNDSLPDLLSYSPVDKFFEDNQGNYYEFSTYDSWASFASYYLIDSNNKTYPTQYIRNKKGQISERWAFLDDGSIVFIAKNETEEINFEKTFQNSSLEKFSFRVSPYKGSSTFRNFDVKKVTNINLVEGYRDTENQGEEPGKFNKGRCKIQPMDRVVIFMTPRFLKDGFFNQQPESDLIRVFTGVVSTVQQSYNQGQHQIIIQGEDVTKYMRISIINVNPALELSRFETIDQTSDEHINVWAQILQGLTTPEIIRLMTLGSDALKVTSKALNQTIDGIGFYKLAVGDDHPQNLVYDIKTNTVKKTGVTPGVARYDFRAMLGELFKENSVHIIDPFRPGATGLKGFRTYELSLGNNYSFYQADFKTRRDIAYKAAEDSHFNFYADRFGHIWFHPYRFDINWILSATLPEVYIIDDASIISYGFVEDDTNIFTSVYATTEPDFGQQPLQEIGFYHGSFRDETAMLKYGQRIFVASNPIVNTKTLKDLDYYASQTHQSLNRDANARSMEVYAKSLLKRLLAEKYQGQVVIGGRPEIDPGRPIYIPMRNMIYYLETVETNLSFGSGYTTTLHFSYGRKPWEYLPELITFSSNDEVYLTDAHILP